jgi:hypothetical protein
MNVSFVKNDDLSRLQSRTQRSHTACYHDGRLLR